MFGIHEDHLNLLSGVGPWSWECKAPEGKREYITPFNSGVETPDGTEEVKEVSSRYGPDQSRRFRWKF